MKHPLKIPLALLALLATAGCLKVKQLVLVNPDGSGNIVVSTAYAPETVAMMTQFSGLDAATAQPGGATALDLFYDEETLRAAARELGEGVTLQKSEKIDQNGTRGSIAVYAFDDIRRVKINTRQNLDLNEAMGAIKSGSDLTAADYIQFAFTTGTTRRLTILMPQFKSQPAPTNTAAAKSELAALGGAGGIGGLGGALGVQMFKGMEMSFALQVKGEVVKSTASHPDPARKDRFTLLGVKLDELMSSPEFQKIANTQVTDQGEMMKLLYTLPGAHLETNREVVIEFRPAK